MCFEPIFNADLSKPFKSRPSKEGWKANSVQCPPPGAPLRVTQGYPGGSQQPLTKQKNTTTTTLIISTGEVYSTILYTTLHYTLYSTLYNTLYLLCFDHIFNAKLE